jgi:hypothetical protein
MQFWSSWLLPPLFWSRPLVCHPPLEAMVCLILMQLPLHGTRRMPLLCV